MKAHDLSWRHPNKVPSFWEMKERAAMLDRDELKRHAHVSIDNRHKCQECFTCACAAIYLGRHISLR